VPPLAVGCVLLAALLAASWLADRLPSPWRRLPVPALGVLVGLAAAEIARYDATRGDALYWVGTVAAPVVTIFGASAEGVRRWYGWPDLGRLPGRAAAVAGLLLLGVLVGGRVKETDVRVTIARAQGIRDAVAAWRSARDGAWPASLAEAAPDAPRTRMGLLDPPPFAYDPARRRLAFPLDGRRRMTLDLATEGASWAIER
jgi:hypothetical protein